MKVLGAGGPCKAPRTQHQPAFVEPLDIPAILLAAEEAAMDTLLFSGNAESMERKQQKLGIPQSGTVKRLGDTSVRNNV